MISTGRYRSWLWRVHWLHPKKLTTLGDVVGDVVGDVAVDVMGDVVGDVMGDVTGAPTCDIASRGVQVSIQRSWTLGVYIHDHVKKTNPSQTYAICLEIWEALGHISNHYNSKEVKVNQTHNELKGISSDGDGAPEAQDPLR
jgi:hypothetical protein